MDRNYKLAKILVNNGIWHKVCCGTTVVLEVDIYDILFIRYGKGSRGDKVLQAEQRGAVGVIMYTDPHDYGMSQGQEYPNERGLNRDSVQVITNIWSKFSNFVALLERPHVKGVNSTKICRNRKGL